MRIAVISDIHEDIVNLQLALDQIFNFNIDEIICLGDIIGFESSYYKFDKIRSAQKCFQLLNKYSDIIVAGNHELHATDGLPHFRKKIGFPENWYSISMEKRKEIYGHKFFLYRDESENDLNKEEKEAIKKLNSWEVLELDNMKLLFSHFIYPDINGNLKVFSNSKDGFFKHFEWMKKLEINISFVGHAHISGVGIVTKKGSKINKFGRYSLNTEPQVILCPSIGKGKHKNGFVLFDSASMNLEVIAL